MGKTAQFLRQYGPTLLERGFPIVPIKKGYKFPKGLKHWQRLDPTKTMLNKWLSNGFADGGVGLKTREFPAVDVDVKDEAVAAKLAEFIRRELGQTCERVGEAPKTLFVFRTETPFPKLRSKVFEDWLGERHCVEILGDGQQFVAYAVHPDTQRPYTWVGDGLADITPDSLPAITRDDAKRVIDAFHSLRPSDWVEVEDESEGQTADEGDGFANFKPPLSVANDRIARALKLIDNSGEGFHYDTWIRYGFALYHQFNGGDVGFELWDAWSKQSDKYDADVTRDKWYESGAFKANLTRAEPVTVATILHDADQARRAKDPDPLETALKRYIYIEQGDRVADLEQPPRRCLSKLSEHRNRTANVRVETAAPTVKNPKRTISEPVHKLWLAHPDRQTADDTTFAPGRPRIIRDGSVFVNTFEMAEHPDTGSTNLVGPALLHFDYLIPCENERTWFLDWLAWNVQKPERRCLVTPLHVSTAHGTGRGWCVRLLERLLGEWNLKKTKMEHLAGESQFNDYLHESLVVAVEEVREGNQRYSVSDRIRDVLTEPRLEVNRKYGSKSTENVYANFFLMSNHRDALIIPQEDRRICVLSGPDEAQPGRYYDELYGWLNGPGVAQLFHMLRRRDLSRFKFKVAPDTPGKRTMIEAAKSETESALDAFLEDTDHRAMTLQYIRKSIEKYTEDSFHGVNDKQLSMLVKRKATRHTRVRVGGVVRRVWIFGVAKISQDEIKSAISLQNDV